MSIWKNLLRPRCSPTDWTKKCDQRRLAEMAGEWYYAKRLRGWVMKANPMAPPRYERPYVWSWCAYCGESLPGCEPLPPTAKEPWHDGP